jgi:hypothetical protein
MAPVPVFVNVGTNASFEDTSVVAEYDASDAVRITHVDGVLVKDVSGGRVSKGIYMTPGNHVFTFYYLAGSYIGGGFATTYSATGTFSAALLKGHSYTPLILDRSAKNVTVSLRDKGVAYNSDCLIAHSFRPKDVMGCAP